MKQSYLSKTLALLLAMIMLVSVLPLNALAASEYDDSNVYLMWEMTNVQDVVAPSDNYPLSQGTLWQTQEFPFFIAVDTGKADTAIGKKGALSRAQTATFLNATSSTKKS